jgi:hypothetical protein
MEPVAEGTGSTQYHPRYGERIGPVRGGTIDVMDLLTRAAVCMNLNAVSGDTGEQKKNASIEEGRYQVANEGEEKGRIKEENSGMVEEDNPGEERVPMGGADRKPHLGVGSVRGLPIGVMDGRSPVELKNETYTNKKRKVRLEIPMTFPRDGRGYTKCFPLAATLGFGERQLKCLMDPDSNTLIVDLNTLKEC